MTERMTPFPRLAVALAYAFSDERHTTQRPGGTRGRTHGWASLAAGRHRRRR